MNAIIWVMAGGALGAAARFLVGKLALASLGPNYPYGTAIVNILGGFAMGVLVGYLARFGNGAHWGGENWRLLIGVGVLGGFTTFSSFSLEIAQMMERGHMTAAFLYAVMSVVLSVVALFAGLGLMRGLAGAA